MCIRLARIVKRLADAVVKLNTVLLSARGGAPDPCGAIRGRMYSRGVHLSYRNNGGSKRLKLSPVSSSLTPFFVEALDAIAEGYARIGERSCDKREKLIREIVEAYIGATFERHTGIKLGEYIVARASGKVYSWQGKGENARFMARSPKNQQQKRKLNGSAVTCSLPRSSPGTGVMWSSPAEQNGARKSDRVAG